MTAKGPAKATRKAVLTVYVIKSNGEKELLDFRVVDSESEAQWELFLNHLYNRDLEGTQLSLIIPDGGTELHAALQMVYGHVKRQRVLGTQDAKRTGSAPGETARRLPGATAHRLLVQE